MNKTNLNQVSHEKIVNASKIFLKKEFDKTVLLLPALEWLEDVKNNNLNDVTDIYIFEEGFGDTEVNLKNTILHAITSILSFDYTEENINYIKEIILVVDNKKSDVALDYFLKIGAYHKKFSDNVLNFIETNLNLFTKNKLNIIAFYLASVYDKNENNITLFKRINDIHSQKHPKKDESSHDIKTKNSNNSPLEEFQEIVAQEHNKVAEKINTSLFNDICRTAEIVDKTDNDVEEKAIIESLRERFKKVDLNQVTDLFIYNQMFFTSNENPLPTPSMLCINIGKLFTEQNLHYTAAKVYSNDDIEGGCALSFLGYLALHEHHRTYVLNFIKENFEGFSQNKKTECIFQLKNYLADDETAKQIIDQSAITEYVLTFSTEGETISRPITFKLDNASNDRGISSNEDLSSPRTNNFIENIVSIAEKEELKTQSPWWKFW